MIEVQNLSKRFGNIKAVRDISFSVKEGEVVGFLGPNGAGKTTTMNMLTGYTSPSDGIIKIGDIDILEDPLEAKALVGYLPEHPPLYLDMTVKEYLNFAYSLKRVRGNRAEQIFEICEMVGIQSVYGRMVGNLSKGFKQRVGLAQAILGDPKVLILDEPTVGLDPVQIIDIRKLLKQLGRKHTVILSSHILPEVQAVCDRILVINQGEIVADGTPGRISAKLRPENNLTLLIEGPRDALDRLFAIMPDIARAENKGERDPGVFEYLIKIKDDTDIRRDLFARAAEHNWPILGLSAHEFTLEEIFLRLTSGDTALPTDMPNPPADDDDAPKDAKSKPKSPSKAPKDQPKGGKN